MGNGYGGFGSAVDEWQNMKMVVCDKCGYFFPEEYRQAHLVECFGIVPQRHRFGATIFNESSLGAIIGLPRTLGSDDFRDTKD